MAHMYYDTFIAVAPDYDGEPGKVPAERAKPSVAQMQYDMLIDEPFVHTQEDVLFSIWAKRQGMTELASDEIVDLRDEFFAKGQACLRASPLTKTHGWGVLFDADGRAALVAADSAEYQTHLQDPDLEVVYAMRSKRLKK